MIEPFEEWRSRPPDQLSSDQKRWLLQNKSCLAEYLEGCRNDITQLPLLEFITALESNRPCIFSIPDMPDLTLKWFAVSDMEGMGLYREKLIPESVSESN